MSTYLFDFDGTLVDSMPTYGTMMKEILDHNHIAYDDNLMKIITPLGFRGTAEYYVTLGVPQSVEEMMAYMFQRAKTEYTYHIPAKPHVPEVLRQLKQAGHDLNVLTASPHMTLDPCLKRLGLYDLFSNVWSCDDFSTTKADPNIYRMAAEKMGVDLHHVLFLDDNYNADKTASEAGMKVCAVYDDSSREYVEEMKEAADYYIYDFSELPAIRF